MSKRIPRQSVHIPKISASNIEKETQLNKRAGIVERLVAPKFGKTLEIPTLSKAISQKATMPSKEKVRQAARKIFSMAASRRGLSESQIDKIHQTVMEKYPIWRQQEKVDPIEGGQGRSGYSIKFDPGTKSVITYFDKGDPLGKGAFGEVREAFFMLSETFHESTEIVCKAPKDLSNEAIREDHLKEVAITKRLKGCKNVVQYVHVNDTGLLIERMSGTLEGLLKDNELTPMGKLRISKDLVHGMAEMHEKGLVHRDLHKGNILFSPGETFKIGDFGLTQAIGEERTGVINTQIATPEDMNSRLFGPKNSITTSSDVWSMGLLLYEIENGEPPPFATGEGLAPINQSATKRGQILREIRKLPKNMQNTILLWDGKGQLEIKQEYRKLAQDYFSAKLELREAHKNYLIEQKQFIQKLNEGTAPPKTKIEGLIKKMLILDPKKRINSKDAWKELAGLQIDRESEIAIPRIGTSSPSPTDETPTALTLSIDDASSPYSAASPYNTSTRESIDYSTASYSNGDIPDSPSTESNPTTWEYETTNEYTEEAFEEITMEPMPKQPDLSEKQLFEAIKSGDVNTIRYFATQGIDITAWQDTNGNTLLHLASTNDAQNPALTFLLQIGADANAKNASGDTPLHLASMQRNKEGVEILVKAGGDLTIKNNEGLTPKGLE